MALLFGGSKIPELARSLGKAKGEFKKGLAEGEKEEAEAEGKPAKELEKA
ncbi:MAG: twin-arginine translocase TatA/TatE family subunit [Kiritimatiellae bacterium]|nr:twin-arginine translocase TatA/TatE family subunit [Kiritimatiellia bacterium]